jgi:Putative zinc-finger
VGIFFMAEKAHHVTAPATLHSDSCNKPMEHSYIEEHNIAERYLLDKLSAQERMRFEEHLKNCVQCVNLLEVIGGLRMGLQIVAAKEIGRRRAYVEAGLLAWIARLSRAKQAVLLAGVILLIALPILEWSRARRELVRATQTAAEWQRRYEEREQAAHNLTKEMQARDQLAARPESERRDRPRLPNEAKNVTPPQVVVPVFALSVTRSGVPDLTQPVNQIKLSPTSKLIILLLESEPDPGLRYYRAAISTADGRNIWRESNLSAISNDALALSFNSSLFKPGNYLLTLEGFTTQNRYVLIAQYTFGVLTR